MRFGELIALNPGLEGFPILPARNDEYLVLSVGLQDFHGDETWEPLYMSAARGEAVHDLSAAPSLTGRLLKIAIKDTSELLPGDHDAAATDPFGHLERPQGHSHQLPDTRSMRRVLGDTDVDFEVRHALCQAL